jgi:hypothetical protein
MAEIFMPLFMPGLHYGIAHLVHECLVDLIFLAPRGPDRHSKRKIGKCFKAVTRSGESCCSITFSPALEGEQVFQLF